MRGGDNRGDDTARSEGTWKGRRSGEVGRNCNYEGREVKGRRKGKQQ